MNATHRGLNRLGIFLFGFVLLVVGVAAAAAAVVPAWLDRWKSVSADVEKTATGFVKATLLAGLGQSWVLIIIPIVCAILILLLVLFIFRQGHGHTHTLLVEKATTTESGTPTGGSVIIDGRVAEQTIQHALDNHPRLISSNVGTYRVRRTPTLMITANVRRGVSPQDIREFIDQTVAAWDWVLGREIPVVIQINAGLITRVAKPTRLARSKPQTITKDAVHAQ